MPNVVHQSQLGRQPEQAKHRAENGRLQRRETPFGYGLPPSPRLACRRRGSWESPLSPKGAEGWLGLAGLVRSQRKGLHGVDDDESPPAE